MHLNRLKCYHQSRQICISFGMHLVDSQRRTVKAPVMISAGQRLDAYIKILESPVNILNITFVISPTGLFRWEKLKMRKHLKAQVCRQKSNINEGNKETSEEEWMMSFIANLICTLFLYIKKNCINVLVRSCQTYVRREYSWDVTDVAVKPTFHCPLVLLISLNIFKRFMFRTTVLREYMLHLCHVVSQLCQIMAGVRVVVVFCQQSSGCSLKILKSLGPELLYPLLPIVFFGI